MIIKTVVHLIVALLIAFWLGVIAIFSIQNITLVSLNFLIWQSIKLPIGVLLSFCLGIGIILGSLFPLLFSSTPTSKRKRRLG